MQYVVFVLRKHVTHTFDFISRWTIYNTRPLTYVQFHVTIGTTWHTEKHNDELDSYTLVSFVKGALFPKTHQHILTNQRREFRENRLLWLHNNSVTGRWTSTPVHTYSIHPHAPRTDVRRVIKGVLTLPVGTGRHDDVALHCSRSSGFSSC